MPLIVDIKGETSRRVEEIDPGEICYRECDKLYFLRTATNGPPRDGRKTFACVELGTMSVHHVLATTVMRVVPHAKLEIAWGNAQ